MPLRKVHELSFLWFGLPGRLLIKTRKKKKLLENVESTQNVGIR